MEDTGERRRGLLMPSLQLMPMLMPTLTILDTTMAQMISNYYSDRHFGSWVQDGKWQGSFIVKWIYVKDIPNKDLKDIQLPNNDGRPVPFSRDTQEIPYSQGIEMLQRFIKYE